jgi:hypothetical protein
LNQVRYTYAKLRTDGLSVSQSVSQSVRPSVLASSSAGTRDQILIVVKTAAVLSWGVLPVERTDLSCDRSQSLMYSVDTYTEVVLATAVLKIPAIATRSPNKVHKISA